MTYPKERPGNQKSAEFYDRIFSENPKWTTHYTQSTSYTMWVELVKNIEPTDKIFEVACGTGRLAHMIRETARFKSYVGIDFSLAAVHHARLLSDPVETPLRFFPYDVFETDMLETEDYNTVIATEFLEHIKDDIPLLNRLKKIPRRLKYLMSVPNGWSSDHVRMFPTQATVYDRYSPHINNLTVKIPIRNRYLMIGYNHA